MPGVTGKSAPTSVTSVTATRCPLLGGVHYDSGVLIGACPNLAACTRLSYIHGDARRTNRPQEAAAH
jgi:hypothetical protein